MSHEASLRYFHRSMAACGMRRSSPSIQFERTRPTRLILSVAGPVADWPLKDVHYRERTLVHCAHLSTDCTSARDTQATFRRTIFPRNGELRGLPGRSCFTGEQAGQLTASSTIAFGPGIGPPKRPSRICTIRSSKLSRSTAYIPPRAPSKAQFHAASAWP